MKRLILMLLLVVSVTFGGLRGRYSGAKGVFGVIVAASDSSASDKANAAFVCDGTDDQVQIQAAIDSLSNGGKITFAAGTFSLSSVIKSDGDISFVGAGKATSLKIVDKVETTVTVNFAYDATSIKVADTSGFIIGQHCTIFDDVKNGYDEGVTVKITAIPDSTTLTLNNSANGIDSIHNEVYTYLVSENARIFTTISAFWIDDVDDVVFSNFHLDGNKANNERGNFDNWQNGVTFRNTNRCRVEGMWFDDWDMIGVLGYTNSSGDTEDLTVSNNSINGTGHKEAVHYHGCNNSIVTGNKMQNNNGGVYLFQSDNNIFNNNSISGGLLGFQIIDSSFNECSTSSIKNLSGNTDSGDVPKGISFSDSGGNTSYNLIVNNNIDTIVDAGSGKDGFGIFCDGQYNSIKNNIIRDVEGTAISNRSDSSAVTGNQVFVTTNGADAIINTNAPDCDLSRNKVYTIFNMYGIHITANSDDCTVEGNRIYKDYGTGANWNLNALFVEGDDCIVNDNRIKDKSGMAALNVAGARAVVSGNNIETTGSEEGTDPAVLVSGANSVVTSNVINSAFTTELTVSGAGSVNANNIEI